MTQTRNYGEKLQKVMARAGLASRRGVEQWISAGRVKVNGRTAELGCRVTSQDKIEVDGRVLKLKPLKQTARRVLIYNKPVGEITTRNDPEKRPSVFDNLPSIPGERWIAVGRLDINTAGLLLFTNDGDLAHRLMHPSSGIDREYMVRIHGNVDEGMLQRLRDGVELDDGVAQFTDIVPGRGEGTNRWYYVALMEGRNREVRRLWESQEVQVTRLKRVRFGPIFMPSEVRSGQYKDMDQKELNSLAKKVGLSAEKGRKLTRQELTDKERHQKRLRAGAGKNKVRRENKSPRKR